MTIPSEEEYKILKGLDSKWKWIARDELLLLFTNKPYKTDEWGMNIISNLDTYEELQESVTDDILFQFIQWEDESPYNIQELIKEYEDYAYTAEHYSNAMIKIAKALGDSRNESEETEVKKDIEWLKNQVDGLETTIKRLLDGVTHGTRTSLNGSLATLKDFRGYIDQLDEPETLSQSWIDNNEEMVILTNEGYDDLGNAYSAGTMVKGVPSRKLQNLLVPKHEEVDRAYKDGYEKGKQYATEKQTKETETVGRVLVDYLIASAKLKLALSMEIEELEE